MNSVKQIDVKNHAFYFYEDMIIKKNFVQNSINT